MTDSEKRDSWIKLVGQLCHPIYRALASGELKRRMPMELGVGSDIRSQSSVAMEAVGRSLAGIVPWLALDEVPASEAGPRKELADLVISGLDQAVDPGSPDHLDFTEGVQPLVEAAFACQGFCRGNLWERLSPQTQTRWIERLRRTREIDTHFNNWLLFSAMIEAFFRRIGEPWDKMRVDYAVRQLSQWYKGDGAYGDGPWFRWDYYNSFVIHPMLLDILDITASIRPAWEAMRQSTLLRAQRYAIVQERFIGPDGSFPAVGRSLAYRCGAFHCLAQLALRNELPTEITPAQVRGALTAVISRTLGARETFDDAGWLRIGLCGHQPSLGEGYISTGSLYLCLCAFLPLGLPPSSRFWSDADEPWTAMKVWQGMDISADHKLSDG